MTDNITLPRQTAQQILAALRVAVTPLPKDRQAILRLDAALRTALEQQAEPCQFCGLNKCDPRCMWVEQPLQQPAEPVAWAVQACSKMWRGEFAEIDSKAEAKRIGGTCVAYPLYTTPPQREWVGLTDEDFLEACQIAERGNYLLAFQRIQTKLKERNT